MAMAVPTEEGISNVMAFTSCERDTAIKYLRAKGNDVQAAINGVIDRAPISEEYSTGNWKQDDTRWDEGLWGAGKEYTTDNNLGSGAINLHSLTATAPPSRAPSRNSMQPANQAEADRDLEQAVAMSLGQEGPPAMFGHVAPQQENGVVNSEGKEVMMGPAPREYYENKSTALILHPAASGSGGASTASSEVVPDAEAEHRKHEAGKPRFVKHISNSGYLAEFLTICHEIAGVREAMLMRDFVRSSYGEHPEWWKGHPIKTPRVVNTESGDAAADAEAGKDDDLIVETQRLIAFLDASDRAYATLSTELQTDIGLYDSRSTKKDGSRTSALQKFMEMWVAAAKAKNETFTRLFETSFCFGQGTMRDYYSVELDVDIDENDIADPDKKDDKANDRKRDRPHLMELVDEHVWRIGEDEDEDCYLYGPAEVMVVKVKNKSPGATSTRIEAPHELYLDKYMFEHLEVAKPYREELRKAKKKMAKIDGVERMLTKMKEPNGERELNALDLLKHSQGFFANHCRGLNKDEQTSEDIAKQRPPYYNDVAQKLQKVMDSVNQKLEALAKQKKKAYDTIRKIATERIPELEGKMKHHYTLRGVATRPGVTYVLRQKGDDEDEDMEASSSSGDETTTPAGMQWWGIRYKVPSNGRPEIDRYKAQDYDVLPAVDKEHHEALLIYASDAVNDIALLNPQLPDALSEFIKVDNSHFEKELKEAASRRDPPPYSGLTDEDVPPGTAIKSIERKASSDSMDVQRGDDDDDVMPGLTAPSYEDEGFQDHPDFGLGPSGIRSGGGNGVGGPRWDQDPAPVDIILDLPSGEVDMEQQLDGMERELDQSNRGFEEAQASPRMDAEMEVDREIEMQEVSREPLLATAASAAAAAAAARSQAG
jgi:hypothetical protein